MTKKKIEDDLDEVAYYFDKEGLHFTEYGRHHFTEEEREQIKGLYGHRDEKFSEIALIIAFKLGYEANKIEDIAKLAEAERISLEAETENAIENWDAADVNGILPPSAPIDPLQALLSKHHELGEKIMDIQDTAVRRSLGDDEEEDDARLRNLGKTSAENLRVG